MNVPDDLNDWETAMAANPASRQILQNLKDEVCLDEATCDEFWERLRQASGAPAPRDAWTQAKEAVDTDPTLGFRGRPVPDGHFDSLTRFSLPRKLLDLFDGIDFEAHGFTAAGLNTAPVEELEPLIDEAMTFASMQLGGTVWVTESSQEVDDAKAAPADLMSRLGLPWLRDRLSQDAGPCVELRYDRSKLPDSSPLHVPTSFDGIDFEPFRPNPRCADPHGLTNPVDPGVGPGFPEAVHGPCEVPEFAVDLITL